MIDKILPIGNNPTPTGGLDTYGPHRQLLGVLIRFKKTGSRFTLSLNPLQWGEFVTD
jgi:hypothetical protein